MGTGSKSFANISFGPNGPRTGSVEERLRQVEDIQDIQKLLGLYTLCNDGGWDGQGPSHMGPSEMLFTEDGVWDDCGGDLGKAEGREAIRALFDKLRAVRYVSHNVMNPVIEVDGDTARANFHMMVIAKYPNQWGTEDQDGHSHLGNYVLDLKRTSEGWRFTRMAVRRGRIFPVRGYNPDPGLAVAAGD